MTDIYIAYAREDRERIRPLAEMLQFEGWDVWWDPSEPTLDSSAALDQKLGTAGAILVVWSGYSRGSEHVRSEAATGLYKNKLIQARIDTASPPRPFDQVEVVNLAGWRGEREDPEWRRVVQSIRLYAGQPNGARQQPAAKKLGFPKLIPSKPAYVENDRSVAWVPMVAAGVLVLSAGGVFLLDPFGWRGGGEIRSAEADTPTEEAAAASTAPAPVAPEDILDTAESDAAWEALDRKDVQALRDYANGYPRSSNAETARSLLRVLDAQAWVEAVTADNEAGYSNYLKNFPVNGSVPGAMAVDARDRLVALSAERTQAIEHIQRGLLAMSLYEGEIDGKAGATTVTAMRKFASQKRRNAPSLTSSAPRDLRTFADLIEKTAVDAGLMKPSSEAPMIAAATTNAKPTSSPTPTAPAAAAAPPKPRPSTAEAAEADRQRIARAQEAADQAEDEEKERKRTEALQVAALSKLDATAWSEAQRTGTAAAYQSYLAAHPNGTQAAAARAAIQRLTRPASYSLDQLSPAVRTAAEAARRAQSLATSRAAAAREAASNAQSAPGIRSITAANGDRFESQISGGAPNGLGTRLSGDIRTAGDRYRGEIRAGRAAGVGVYDYGDNPGNRANLQRYEGEHSADGATGYGVTYWKSGDNFAGQDTGGVSRGVLSFANGQRYEGEMRNGVRNGLGVVWSADGQMVQAGRWENGQLVEPLSGGAISLTPGGANP
jgi:peptidoglycan hydrolase-like protein with peptidoglycan-binding domain